MLVEWTLCHKRLRIPRGSQLISECLQLGCPELLALGGCQAHSVCALFCKVLPVDKLAGQEQLPSEKTFNYSGHFILQI